MIYEQALEIAEKVKAQLAPHCVQIEITGGIRLKELEINKIEIVVIPKPYVLIPKPYNIGLFESGIEAVLNQWSKVKGELPYDYMQRKLPGNIRLDLFFAEADNWDYVLAKRTGSAYYSNQRPALVRKCAGLKVKTATSIKMEKNSCK